MKELLLLLAIIAVLLFVVWKIGKRNTRKPLTLNDLDFRIQYSQLNELNAKSLRIVINEMRTRITEERDKARDENKRLFLECDLKRLESLERTFTFKFIEFLPGAKVVYPDLEKFAKLEREYSPDLCCGIYEDKSVNKREFTNRSDVDEVDQSFLSHIQG